VYLKITTMPTSVVECCDNMEFMSRFPDKFFDLILADPEYGIGASEMTMGSGKSKKYSKGKYWDSKPPSAEYFDELFRVSKNQIIFGGNYFNLPLTRSWIFWDKGINGDSSFADGELAWTSFDRVLRKANVRYKGFLGADSDRIHITQKPVQLYKWVLKNYSDIGFKILDPNMGSQSSRIASYDMGFDYWGCEIDPDYFKSGCERFEKECSHLNLFHLL
jgi:site-specific DNA-methyltransferase (adenine-specific)